MPAGKKLFKRLGYSVLSIFLLLNIIAAMHAWRFTHFTDSKEPAHGEQGLSAAQKFKIALTGIPNTRPVNTVLPARPYEVVNLEGKVKLSCWYMAVPNAKGTVLLFHGFGSKKSSMLDKAYLFMDAGYNVFLPDFRGAGESEGNTITIGYKEAEDVKTCYDYIKAKGGHNILLQGASMGAAAILKCLKDHADVQPSGIIIECPFGTMYQTVCIRFKMVGAPIFPMAGLLVFWGGIENGFWAFNHNPDEYAKSVKCPTLLLFGEKDDRVTRGEIDAIYKNLAGPKTLKTYPEAGHNNYLALYKEQWTTDVDSFLNHQ